MPFVIDNRTGQRLDYRFLERKYDYSYPEGLDLRPGSDEHNRLRDLVWQKSQASKRVMSSKYDDWRKTDRVLRAYVSPEWEKRMREEYSKKNENQEMLMPKLIMPVTQANLETLLTYMVAAFFQDPLFKYEGTGPEDTIGAKLMEKVIQQQNDRFHAGLRLHTMLRDSFAYGIGAVSCNWERTMGYRAVRNDTGFFSMVKNLFVRTGATRESEWGVQFEGNKLTNIDPYRFLPDPGVSADNIQDAEFLGWVDRTSYNSLRGRERDPDDFIFNAQYLKHCDGRSSLAFEEGDRDKHIGKNELANTHTRPIDVIWMYMTIIPEEHGLGDSDYPEKWLFGLAGDQVLIAAQPLNLNHGNYPVVIAAPNYDGYSIVPPSRMGLVYDLQVLIDFLYTSHVENVRKAVNNQWLVDPSIVNIYDVNDPRPGKIMRIRRGHWGKKSLDAAMKQFEVRDVTQNHVIDAAHAFEFFQRGTGAVDAVQGIMQHRTSRVSSAEFQGTRNNGLSRLEKDARILSMQAMQPLARMMASHVQQLMSEDTYIKAIGTWAQRLINDYGYDEARIKNERIPVSPMDLIVSYDLVAHDGTIPGMNDPNVWTQFFQTVASNPLLAQRFDLVRIATHMFREMGARNVDEFVVRSPPPPQVMADEQVLQQEQAGNLVPLPGGDGASAYVA